MKYSELAADKAKLQEAARALDGTKCDYIKDNIRRTLEAIADYEAFGIDGDNGQWSYNYPYRIIFGYGVEIHSLEPQRLVNPKTGADLKPGQKLLWWHVLGGNNPFEEFSTFVRFCAELKKAEPPDFIDNDFENYYGWLPHRAQAVIEAFKRLVPRFYEEERAELKKKQIEELKAKLAALEKEAGE